MSFRTSDFWNGQRIARLEFLWSEDWTCSAIAADIGCTRNSVIGKVDRLGLPARSPKPRMTQEEAKRRRIERQRKYDAKRNNRPYQPRKIVMVKPQIVAPPPFVGDLRIPTRDLRSFRNDSANQCRLICDEPPGPDYFACGNETAPGKSYCAHCTEMLRPKPQTIVERIHNHHMGVRRYQRTLRSVA